MTNSIQGDSRNNGEQECNNVSTTEIVQKNEDCIKQYQTTQQEIYQRNLMEIPNYGTHRNTQAFLGAIDNNRHLADILLAHKITDSGRPNRLGCRVPLHTDWDLKIMKQWLIDYEDLEIIDWLTYGFSISRNKEALDPVPASKNHAGANNFPETIDNCIQKELQ